MPRCRQEARKLRRDEHAAVVDHDGVRDDHRFRRGVLEPFVDARAAAHTAAPSAPSSTPPPSPAASAPGSPRGPAARWRPPTVSSAAAPPRAPPGSRRRSCRSARPGRAPRRPAAPARPAGSSRSAPPPRAPPPAAVENMPSGRPASDRRVRADPVVCRPRDNVSNNRYIVRCDGTTARSTPVRGEDLPGPPDHEARRPGGRVGGFARSPAASPPPPARRPARSAASAWPRR